MKLSKIVYFWGACLFLNFTLSQAAHISSTQVGSSSSSSSAASFKTPLQQEADEFLNIWNTSRPTFKADDEAQFFKGYENYINQIIKGDNLAALTETDGEDNLLSYSGNSRQELFESENIELRKAVYQELSQLWKELINKENAFASYFLGYVLAEKIQPESYNTQYHRIICNLLDSSSQKLYSRATNFLLENIQWQKTLVDRNQLLIRRDIIAAPDEALFHYIKTHAIKGETSWNDLKILENILLYNTATPEEYLKVYRNLAKRLKSALILRKEKESPLRIVEFFILSTISVATVLMTQEIINIVNDNPNKIPYYTIGSTQIAAAIIGIIVSVVSYPYITNLVYKYQDWGFKGKLLPSSYSEDEISLQSHLIALLCVVLNKAYDIRKLNQRSYINRVRKFILDQFEVESRTLSGLLSQHNKQYLLLPVGRD